MADSVDPIRRTLFVTHAAPEDNEFALWLSAKLALAGYHVWIDRRRLRGGDDTWDEIDRVLRTEAVKQIVVFTSHVSKPGVKRELGIGDVVARRLKDPKFMIPVRVADVSYADAPPEFIRDNILSGYPNWYDCLAELFETLSDAGVLKSTTAESSVLHRIIEAREEGRRFVESEPERVLTNWFPVKPPERIRYYRLGGLQDQARIWLDSCNIPHVAQLRLVGTFADESSFTRASRESPNLLETAYDISFSDFITGVDLGPFLERADASRDVVNLFRQHFDQLAAARGLKRVEFASGQHGWFFPDELLPSNKVNFTAQDGRRIRRAMTGKFKKLRWHACLIAKPRIWPEPVFRLHLNVVLSDSGKVLSGDETHKRRRRLTKSWWNDVWRDRLLAAAHFLACEKDVVVLDAGSERIEIATWPLTVEVPVSYQTTDPSPAVEEDDDGNVITSTALDDPYDDIDHEDGPSEYDGSEGDAA